MISDSNISSDKFNDEELTKWERIEEYNNVNQEIVEVYNEYKTLNFMGTTIEDFYKCSEKAQETIAVGIRGLMNLEEKHFKLQQKQETKIFSINYDESEDNIIFNEYNEILDDLIEKLENKLNKIMKFKTNNYRNNEIVLKKIKILYKKLQEEIYKRELRKLIGIDIKNLNEHTINLVIDVIKINKKLYLEDDELVNNIKNIKESVDNCINRDFDDKLLNQFILNLLLNDANSKYKSKKYEEALIKYNEMLSIYPEYKDKNTYKNKGNAYKNLGQYEKAIKEYTKAIEIDENYADAYNNKGLSYANLGQYEEAIKEYAKTIEIDKNYIEAYKNKGNAYANLEKYEEAIKEYTKAIEIDENYIKAYNNRANAYRNIQKLNEALNDFLKVKKLNVKKQEYSLKSIDKIINSLIEEICK